MVPKSKLVSCAFSVLSGVFESSAVATSSATGWPNQIRMAMTAMVTRPIPRIAFLFIEEKLKLLCLQRSSMPWGYVRGVKTNGKIFDGMRHLENRRSVIVRKEY